VTVPIPGGLDWLKSSNTGRAWLNRLPDMASACIARWDLSVGPPFLDSYVSLVLPAANQEHENLVLKIQMPHRESDTESDALMAWNGNAAIRLIDQDSELHALLLERCVPGDHLSTAGANVGLDAMIALLPRLWVPAGERFPSLAAEVDRWVRALPAEFEEAGEPFERGLLDGAIETLTDLAASQGEQVLLHQDLHGDNVLSSQREPWLAIDPKPLVGEREFGLSPIIRSYEFGHSRADVVHRLDRLTSELGVDRERSRLWAFGHAVAWGFEGRQVLPRHLETARWLLDV
jgi:streptomycin 6-kinase